MREWAPFCPPSDVFVTSSLSFDAIVIGAGAAGLFCAAQAGQRGLSVLLLDHAEKVAEKIRISGGGRCNFTNRDLDVVRRTSTSWAATRSSAARPCRVTRRPTSSR